MSTGQWIGAILGAIVGFIISGFNPVGAIYGAIIGYTLGGIVDPVKPDVKQPGAPVPQGLQIMTNVIGNPIFDVLGTAKITGQMLFFGKEFNLAIWYRPSKGVRAISGYKYYASWALGICMGPVDCLYTVFRDQDPIWEGELTRPESGGEATIQIEGGGTMVFYFGTDDQVPNINAGTLLPDPTLNTGYRHLCWAFFDAFFMNEYNRMPSMSFVIKKIPPMFNEPMSQIQTYDINPAHALWHTLIEKAGLPVEWVDPVDFLAIATELFGEGRGISILFDVHQATLNYLEAINSHVDCILRYGSDGKFHPKLIRYVSPVGLPVIDESKLLEEPSFSRRSWIDTINEVKVQYSENLGERAEPLVPFVAFDMCSDGTYFYICGYNPVTFKCVVAKVGISSLGLIKQVEYASVSTYQDAYYSIRYDGGFVYLAGYLNNSQTQNGLGTAIVHKRPISDLSALSWAYAFTEAGACCFFRDLVVDDTYVYAVGDYDSPSPAYVLKVKLSKSDGTLIWERHANISQSAWGVTQSGDYVYIHQNYGGVIGVERVPKLNPDSSAVFGYVDQGGLFRGFLSGTFLYISGPSPSRGDTQGMTMKINFSTMAEIWQKRRNQSVGNWDCDFKCIGDGINIFTVGQTYVGPGIPHNQVFQKFDLDGTLILTKVITNPGSASYYYWYTILESGNYIYLCNYYGIERRLKSTLEIG